MIKRFSITLLFFTAFAVIMAHSFIPHHHHEEETATERHEKVHDDDNGLGNLFSHFQHVGINNQFVSTHQSPAIKLINILQADISFITSYNFYLSDTSEPVPLFYPDHPDIYSSSGSAAFSLRGPPSITV